MSAGDVCSSTFEFSGCGLLDQPWRQTEPNQAGFKERKNTFRWQLLSSPWIYLELWSFPTGEQVMYFMSFEQLLSVHLK